MRFGEADDVRHEVSYPQAAGGLRYMADPVVASRFVLLDSVIGGAAAGLVVAVAVGFFGWAVSAIAEFLSRHAWRPSCFAPQRQLFRPLPPYL